MPAVECRAGGLAHWPGIRTRRRPAKPGDETIGDRGQRETGERQSRRGAFSRFTLPDRRGTLVARRQVQLRRAAPFGVDLNAIWQR
jgi:hypothetical protein